ncbi:Eco57I restriction-modification methylase [Agromyces sp. CF514]|uniref:Eco57I restriction-modification methylase domain-containing protein n=1 Tax=Agromyces sp. CF514 TaxID=1881031 RepID=UPI0008F3CCC0|nr:Eco57I restriction-modification methylase domain-containing protein [Agromyces sp. CF514]SFR83587.1 Eco57I restriction-modification methylase [Agromyces sp. CF514]
MSKKFDVVIGNPPYQEEAQGGGTRDTPVYHLFMQEAYKVGRKVVLITPARFLFNAGFTPKAWNAQMLADPHLSVPYYVPNSDDLFPGTIINGGIAVTYRDAEREGEPIGTFTHYPELNTIVHKVAGSGIRSMESTITSSRSYRYSTKLYDENPSARALRPAGNEALISTNAFDQFEFAFYGERPEDGGSYVRVLGLDGKKRATRWIRSDYITGPGNFDTYKVVAPASRGHLGKFGDAPALILGEPMLGEPHVAVTQTFITIGAFETKAEAEACLKYVKSKFARTMLGVLKVTQHNPASTWKFVPQIDFTAASDIDWSKSIAQIDRQLFAKFGLEPDEIAFIDGKVKPME